MNFDKNRLLRRIWAFIGLLLYKSDLGSDLYTGYNHLLDGNYVWGLLTFTFTLLPMQIPTVIFIVGEIQSGRNVVLLFIRSILAIIGSPLMIIYIHVWSIIDPDEDHPEYGCCLSYFKHFDIIQKKFKIHGFLKFCEALGESYPQAALQMYIVFQSLDDSLDVSKIGIYQWVTIATSLTSVVFALATNVFFQDAALSSKVTFFVFGLLTIISRLTVGCVYSMIHHTLFWVPFSAGLATSIIMWSMLKMCGHACSMIAPLDDSVHKSSSIDKVAIVVLSWVLCAGFNCFTLSGMVVSTVNLGFAFGSYWEEVPKEVAMFAISIASVSCLANFFILTCFTSVKNDWMKNKDGTTEGFLH